MPEKVGHELKIWAGDPSFYSDSGSLIGCSAPCVAGCSPWLVSGDFMCSQCGASTCRVAGELAVSRSFAVSARSEWGEVTQCCVPATHLDQFIQNLEETQNIIFV